MEAKLILEDGSVFEGFSRGAQGEVQGEVVFNTSMTGYQEILTDPSYCGQILTMTFPLIGNYGINEKDFESHRPFLRGFIAREICSTPSNWRSSQPLEAFLKENNIVAMEGIDTRALVRNIREKGAMRGILTTKDTPYNTLLDKTKTIPTISEQDLISEVTTEKPFTWENDGPEVVIVDLGLKHSIAKSFYKAGCSVTVVPAFFSAEEILKLNPHGVVFSNGPGDPCNAKEAVKTAEALIGKLPILGICLGHQVLVLALGGKTYKLKFGHRGANHPVKNLVHDKVYITTQNHGFAVAEEGLPSGLQVTQRNLNDGTIEGLREEELQITSIQYHPEAFPGPVDSNYVLDNFLQEIKGGSR